MMRYLILAALVPPLAIIPIHIVWMAILFSKETGALMPVGEIRKMVPFFGILLPFTFVVHVLAGGIALWLSRSFGLTHLIWWLLLYMTPLGFAALVLTDTWRDLEGAGVRLIFALIISLLAWPFIRPALSFPSGA